MAKTLIYPAAISYLSNLSEAASGMKEMGVDLDNSTATIVAARANAMMAAVNELIEVSAKEDFASTNDHMQYCANDIRALMDKVRDHADTLESEVADKLWPLPKYQEMLFIK